MLHFDPLSEVLFVFSFENKLLEFVIIETLPIFVKARRADEGLDHGSCDMGNVSHMSAWHLAYFADLESIVDALCKLRIYSEFFMS